MNRKESYIRPIANAVGVRRRKFQTNTIAPSCKIDFDKYRDEMCKWELCEPGNRSGYGRSLKCQRIDIERDGNEMNINIEILFGQDCVTVKLLLDTGAQRFFISHVYEANLKGLIKQKSVM